MTRIAILGIGGVGGYLGGKLATKYSASGDVEIIFIARGENKKAIEENGLKLVAPSGEDISRPHLVSDDPSKIGEVDYLVCCVKSYHLEESLSSLRKCITNDTVILPLLNGVDSRERIEKLFPENEVWDGCVYIMARLSEPGVVTELGNIHQYHFGSTNGSAEKLAKLETIFSDAGIDTFRSEDIEQTIWDKFLLISTIASLTSAEDLTIQEVFADDVHHETLLGLMRELIAVGAAKDVTFSKAVFDKTLEILNSTPVGGTSSMHSDFMRGGKTEYESLTEFVVKQGSLLNVPTPNYEATLKKLIVKTQAASA